jgi:tetratricopeptide (TPR) repeat protein
MKRMKRTDIQKWIMATTFAIAALLVTTTSAKAQSAILNLPDISQHARATQRIGITDITIDYHRPLLRGRKIFGGLLPYGKVWRAGADYNTTIEFSDPVTIEGQPLPKGVYGLHMIPGETSWVLIFSRNATSWGSFTYDQSEDALRVSVTPQAAENQEALSYAFGDPQPDSVVVTMRWEKVAVPFKIEVNMPEIVQQSLRNQLRGRAQFEWQPWEEAANYLLQNKLSADEALKDADQSIGVEDRFENEITKARALDALGRNDEGTAARNKAVAMGSQLQMFSFARVLQGFGQQGFAMEIFRLDVSKDPHSYLAHDALARIAVTNGDYDTALKEMKLAAAVAPGGIKAQIPDIIRQLEDKVDIN